MTLSPQHAALVAQLVQAVDLAFYDGFLSGRECPPEGDFHKDMLTESRAENTPFKRLADALEAPDPAENAVGAAEREVGRAVYERIEALMDAKAGTPEGRELSYLADLAQNVEEYGAYGGPDAPFIAPDPALEALRELSEKATAGPWSVSGDVAGRAFAIRSETLRAICGMARYPGHDPDDEDAANRELIAAAVNYVRQRLAEQEPKP